MVVLVLDASECADTGAERFTITQQDFRLAELIAEEGRACVIAINKWDTVPDKTSNSHVTFKAEVLAQLRAISWANVLFTSASTGGTPSMHTLFPRQAPLHWQTYRRRCAVDRMSTTCRCQRVAELQHITVPSYKVQVSA